MNSSFFLKYVEFIALSMTPNDICVTPIITDNFILRLLIKANSLET
jgi:hypothetical protein